MAETANYHLYITDDSNETFINWRRKMNGVNESNMIRIDEALATKERVFIGPVCPEELAANDTWLKEVV